MYEAIFETDELGMFKVIVTWSDSLNGFVDLQGFLIDSTNSIGMVKL